MRLLGLAPVAAVAAPLLPKASPPVELAAWREAAWQDWRPYARVANIDVSMLTSTGSSTDNCVWFMNPKYGYLYNSNGSGKL